VSLSIAFDILIGVAFGLLWLGVVGFLFWWLDRLEGAPLTIAGLAFMWGWLMTPVVILVVRDLIGPIFTATVLPNAESTLPIQPVSAVLSITGALCVSWLIRGRFDLPVDALIIGTAVGVGCGGASSVLGYGLATTSWFDVPFGVSRDAVIGALLGAAFGWASILKAPVERVALILAALAAASGIGAITLVASIRVVRHHLWLQGGIAAQIVSITVMVSVYAVISWMLLLLVERPVLKSELTMEYRLGTVPEWAAGVMPSYLKRLRGDWWPSRQERVVISSLLSRLAFRRRQVVNPAQAGNGLGGLEVVRLRQRIRHILTPQGDQQASESVNQPEGGSASLRTSERCGKHDVNDAPRHLER